MHIRVDTYVASVLAAKVRIKVGPGGGFVECLVLQYEDESCFASPIRTNDMRREGPDRFYPENVIYT